MIILITNKQMNIIKELGYRIKLYRVAQELTQVDLEKICGVSAKSISRLESGQSVQLESFVKIMVALGLQDNFDVLIPDEARRPSNYLNKGKADAPQVHLKRRVRKKAEVKRTFKWGDEI